MINHSILLLNKLFNDWTELQNYMNAMERDAHIHLRFPCGLFLLHIPEIHKYLPVLSVSLNTHMQKVMRCEYVLYITYCMYSLGIYKEMYVTYSEYTYCM